MDDAPTVYTVRRQILDLMHDITGDVFAEPSIEQVRRVLAGSYDTHTIDVGDGFVVHLDDLFPSDSEGESHA